MIKKLLSIQFIVIFTLFSFVLPKATFAQQVVAPTPVIIWGCPPQLADVYAERGEQCITDYATFQKDPATYHLWIEDPEITAQGKANERARQFIYWVLNKSALDEDPVLRRVWITTSLVAFALAILVAAMFGIRFIVGKRTNFQTDLKIWPTILKIATMLLYIAFSASIVFILIQLSEILMKFFIDNLGGRQLFNIYFGDISNEGNYVKFIGRKDLNIRVQESVDAELFLLRLTNITYYVLGTMLILRKILLWFLLFVSPFLALLMPFVFIRNIGWIWIGVFFQWLFYGPLLALFLGALNQIWQSGIPFDFDFSRVNKNEGYIYPTATNILYGGPAQELAVKNNGNYVDTFVEYIISLIMLWAVTFFPWWLLRIFRDYCCDGIYAMKNVLLAMYDQMRGGNPNGPKPGPVPTMPSLKLDTPLTRDTEIRTNIKMTTMEEIRRTETHDITKTLSLQATKLTDIARMETNKETNEAVRKNLNLLSNPIKAQTPAERQQYMNLRTELFSRAVKNDSVAKSLLSSTSTSQLERQKVRDNLLKTTSQFTTLSKNVSSQTNLSEDKINMITKNYMTTVAKQTAVVSTISQLTKLPAQQVQSVLTSYTQHMSKPINRLVSTVSTETNTAPDKVRSVIKLSGTLTQQAAVVNDVAQKSQLQTENVAKAVQSMATATEGKATDQSVVKLVSAQANITEAKAQAVTQNVMSSVSQSEAMVQKLQDQTGLNKQQVQTVLTTYVQNINQPNAVIADKVKETAGVEQQKTNEVIKTVTQDVAASKEIVQDVAAKEGVKEQEVAQVIEAQMPLATETDQHVEQTIAIPPSISIEDYEEVKEMWTKHYEEGDVPVSENIQSRDEWVDQDIVLITNTLNKLMSEDENIKQEGLDELGFILPIFTINNLKGDELLVYLKAKLTAAKTVQKSIEKEKKLRLEIAKEKEDAEDTEQFVDLKKKKEEVKYMELEQEMELPEEKAKTPESKPEEELNENNNSETSQTNATSLDEDPLEKIKGKLDEKITN